MGDLAWWYQRAVVILCSPLVFSLQRAFPDSRKTSCFHAFPSTDKLSEVSSPLWVSHSVGEEVISFFHSLVMPGFCPELWSPSGVLDM